MKNYKMLLFAALAVFVLLGIIAIAIRDRRVISIDTQQKAMATNALRIACSFLWIDALPQPGGEGCTSISNAVYRTLQQQPGAFAWQIMPEKIDAFIHVNPDWNKWVRTATNEHAFSNELAAYSDPLITSTNESERVFIGITFGQQLVQITNPPSWRPARELTN